MNALTKPARQAKHGHVDDGATWGTGSVDLIGDGYLTASDTVRNLDAGEKGMCSVDTPSGRQSGV